MSIPLSLAETAAEVGLSADRFRKVWRTWVATRQFPYPFRGSSSKGRRGESFFWEKEKVDVWKSRGVSANENGHLPIPANERGPAARQKAVLRSLMGGRGLTRSA